jgi:hypothetical protein
MDFPLLQLYLPGQALDSAISLALPEAWAVVVSDHYLLELGVDPIPRSVV